MSKYDNSPLPAPPPLLLETERLKLRAMRADDAQLIFDLYASDPMATRFMSFRCTGRLEDTANYTRSIADYFLGIETEIKQFTWVVELKENSLPIGSAGFGPKNQFTLTGGYILGRSFWGRGFATEAWRALLTWAQALSGLYRVEAFHESTNLASGRVLQKSGMTFEGILRRAVVFPNLEPEPRDIAVYSWIRPATEPAAAS